MATRQCIPVRAHALFILAALGIGYFSGHAAGQAYKSEIGFDELVSTYGVSLENGTGIRVLQAEALSSGNYMPSVGNSEFTGKSITNGTSPPNAGASNHATAVGRYFYGNSSSIAPGITDVTVASADDFINRYAGVSDSAHPIAQGYHVSNHSYVGSLPTSSTKINFLRRFDSIINRDDTVAVVGANNGSSLSAPDLWSHSFNAITVGRSDGLHSHGVTTDYGAGRATPDIVVPMQGTPHNFTSYATPVVGASAALLKQTGGFDVAGNSLAGGRNEVIRATLFAGATKNEFTSWDKTSTRPIDDVYGFGELNIYNSYTIHQGGQYAAFKEETRPSENLGDFGWDYGQFGGADLFYNFEVKPNSILNELSAVLAWNVDVTNTSTDPNLFTPTHQLSNLNLELFNSNGDFLASLLQASVSTAYNYEHIYWTDPLEAGKYTFRITGDLPVNYGFAWRFDYKFSTAPEPSSLALLMLASAMVVRVRNRMPPRCG